jgi:hypothetical protein
LAMVAMARVPRADDAWRHREATWTASRASPAANASDRAGWHAAASPPRRSGVATAAAARVAAREIEVGAAAADAIGILKAAPAAGGCSGDWGGVTREGGRKGALGVVKETGFVDERWGGGFAYRWREVGTTVPMGVWGRRRR